MGLDSAFRTSLSQFKSSREMRSCVCTLLTGILRNNSILIQDIFCDWAPKKLKENSGYENLSRRRSSLIRLTNSWLRRFTLCGFCGCIDHVTLTESYTLLSKTRLLSICLACSTIRHVAFSREPTTQNFANLPFVFLNAISLLLVFAIHCLLLFFTSCR